MTEEEDREWEIVDNLEDKLSFIARRLQVVTTEDGWLNKKRTLSRIKPAAEALQKIIDEIEAYEEDQ